MTKKTLNVSSSLVNELEGSKWFAHKKEQNSSKNVRTGEQVSSSSGEQMNRRTGAQAKEPIGEKIERASFNIFMEQVEQIDWYVAEKKRNGNRSYSKSVFMRELLQKFFDKEKKRGRMKFFDARVNR